MKYILSLCLTFMLLAVPAESQSKKEQSNKDDDKIPATITAEYRQKTLDLMKEFSYYDGYEMIVATLNRRYSSHNKDIPANFVDSVLNTKANNDAYLNALVELYAKEFSLNEVRQLHAYFTSDVFRKANMGAMAFQANVDAILEKILTEKETELIDKMKKAGYKVIEPIRVKMDVEPDEIEKNN